MTALARGWVRTSAVVGAAAMALLGCAAADDDGPVQPERATTSPSEASGQTPASEVQFDIEDVDTFDEPWAMAFLPGGELLVTERGGTLLLRNQDTGDRAEVSGVPDVWYAGQGGLGDVVPSPSFAQDSTVYLSWAEGDQNGATAVVGRARLNLDGEEPALEGLRVIWRQSPTVAGAAHYSHRLAFSPDGQYLFVSSGDRQKLDPAQDLGVSLGKIVRLDVNGAAAQGNPFADQGGVSAEIYSYGHRNVLGLEFDEQGRLWASEMGPAGGDELNLIKPGANYGWPEASNGAHYDGADIPDHEDGDGFEPPKASWNPSISPGSLLIYRDDLIAPWQGDAFLGALSGEALVRVDLDGESAGEIQTIEMDARIRAVEEAPDGSIWILEDGDEGRLRQLTPR